MKLLAHQIEVLRQNWSTITKIDPSSEVYKSLTAYLDNLPQPTLKQLSEANINFVSSLARNRVHRKKPTNTDQLMITRAQNDANRKGETIDDIRPADRFIG